MLLFCCRQPGCRHRAVDGLTEDTLSHQADSPWRQTTVNCLWLLKMAEDCVA